MTFAEAISATIEARYGREVQGIRVLPLNDGWHARTDSRGILQSDIDPISFISNAAKFFAGKHLN